mgnify:CR=1 FL=1
MAKAINHKERKREIRAIGLRLFARHGFDAVHFGMIAKEANVSRTLLYTYFKDKRQIFNEAIDEATNVIAVKYYDVVRSRLSADAKIRQMCIAVFAMLFDNRDFLCVIVDFLCAHMRGGKVTVDNIMRHTMGMRRILHSFIVEAIHRGEYARSLKAKFAAEGVRVDIDSDAGKLGAKIRRAQLDKVPFMLVVGKRDQEAGVVSVRSREKGDVGAMSPEAFLELFKSEVV